MIALVQLLSLGYGLHTMYQARPVYVVFSADRFDLVTAVDILPESLAKATRAPYQSLPLLGPQTIGARMPSDPDEKSALLFSALRGGPDVQQLPQYYLPYAEVAQEAVRKAQPLEALMARNEVARVRLASWLKDNRREASSVKWLPLLAKARELTVLVDGGSGTVLDMLALQPD